MNDECSGCSLLERNLYQYGVHAKIIVFCKTYNTLILCAGCTGGAKGSWSVKKFRYEDKNSEKVEKNSGIGD